ncbi:MAG: hypothetical protein WB792_10995 [Desulfobacterales bacterium]
MAVRLRMVWLVPVFVNLCWIPYFHLPLKAANAAELSVSQGQKQTTPKKSPIHPPDLSVKDPVEEPRIIYDGPGGKLLKLKVKADILETFRPDIDIFQNKRSVFDETFSSSSSFSNASSNRFEIFRLEQKLKGFNCGLEYRYVAKHLNDFNRYKNKTGTKTKVGLKNDQEGVEIWGEKNIGFIGIKTFFSRFLDNVDHDPTLPRMLTHKYGLEMKYRMHLLPLWISFFHSREESENNLEIRSSEYQGIQKEAYNGSLKYYGGKRFDVTASTSYSLSRDLLHPDQETERFRNGIRSSIHPAPDLTITPVLSFGEYRYLWYGEREIHPSASLFITYRRISNVVDLSFRGRYSQTKNTDQTLDSETLSTSIGLSWHAKSLFIRKIGYSLNLGFNQYVDNIQPDSSYNALSASFKLDFQL